MTELFNLATGEMLTFSIPAKDALRVAFEMAQGRMALPGLAQKPLEQYRFVETENTISLGDFCYLKPASEQRKVA